MKRTVADVLRRGFQNAVANWQLLLIHFAENVLLVMIIVGAGFATVLPVIISIVSHPPSELESAEDLRDFVLTHVGTFLYAFAVVTVIGLIVIAIHSFVVAGVARVLVDGNRRADSALTRDRFRAFTFEAWLEGGRKDWLAVFWIYNFVYGLVGLIAIIPFCLVAVIEIFSLVAEMKVAAIATGCIGVPIVLFLAIFSSVLASVWSRKAIIVCVEEARGATDAMRSGWQQARADMTRHFGVAFILFVISIGGGGLISMLSFMFSLPAMAHGGGILFLPVRILLSAVSAVFNSAMGVCSIAAFAALSEKS
jgi:hypothetical protein